MNDMKNTHKNSLLGMLALTIMLSVAFCSNAFAQAHAGEYMDQIATTYGPIKKDTWEYMVAVANGRSARKIDKRRKELITSIDAARGAVTRMKPWESDASLRDSAAAYLKLSKSILLEDYGRIIDMEEVAEQSYDLMEAYLLARKKASERYKAASEQLQLASTDFAARHNVTLRESENDKLSQKMKVANEMFDYYDKLYLIMFKAQVQETYAIQALSARDISGATQSNAKLAEYTKEGLQNLNSIPDFNGDNALKSATQTLLNFFKQESEKTLTSMIDFQLSTENFTQIRKSIESKAPKDRTKEEIDNYNAAVTEYNKGLESYNKMSVESDQERLKAINNWNATAQSFMARHVPNK